MSDEEAATISRQLEGQHRLFYAFWTMASVTFTDDVAYCKTAMVLLPKRQKPRIVINQAFWDEMNEHERERAFIISHECLHSILNHGMRNGKEEVPSASFADINIAQDITINEMIESLFGISRHNLRGWERFCWISTVFKPEDGPIKPNQPFTYYLAKIAGKHKDKITIDQHGGGDGFELEEDDVEDVEDDTLDSLLDELTDEELEKLHASISRGKNSSFARALLKREKAKKIDFESIVQGLKASAIRRKMAESDTFVHEHRRFISLRNGLLLPGPHEARKFEIGRLKTVLFMDVSGSCIHNLPYFNAVVQAFEKEREIFDISAFVFDTKVTPYKVGDAPPVGGGTYFNILERKIQVMVHDKKSPMRYPDCVVVITDGLGNVVKPQMPTRWIWLLSDRSSTSCFPASCRRHLLSNVTFGKGEVQL